MKFLFDGDGVLGLERWLGAGSFLDEVGFSVKACVLFASGGQRICQIQGV